MADDIVTRLRSYETQLGAEVCRDAADEIERLRGKLRHTKHLLEQVNYELARLSIDLHDCRGGRRG